MNGSKGSWGDLALNLIGQFLLLRDFFGYLLPGLVLVGLASYSGEGAKLLSRGRACLPFWTVVILLLIICYVAGHFAAAVGYSIQDVVVRLVAMLKSRKSVRKRPTKLPLHSESSVLRYRAVYPQLFIELDRRDTLALLRTGLGASFLLGCWFLGPSTRQVTLFFIIGVIFLLSGFSGRRHVALYRVATLRAALRLHRN
jgi:hypothetical protein